MGLSRWFLAFCEACFTSCKFPLWSLVKCLPYHVYRHALEGTRDVWLNSNHTGELGMLGKEFLSNTRVMTSTNPHLKTWASPPSKCRLMAWSFNKYEWPSRPCIDGRFSSAFVQGVAFSHVWLLQLETQPKNSGFLLSMGIKHLAFSFISIQ